MYRIKATAWLPGHPETKKSATLKIYEELKGYWLDVEGNLLTQVGGVNPTICFGQEVKIKVVATTIPNDKKIDIEIKAKSGDDQIPLDDSRQSLKLTFESKKWGSNFWTYIFRPTMV
ncbi:MAG: hypothetical protein AAGI25_20940 [Bacteroidota bacterium]